MSEDPLLPQHDEQEAGGFDVVLRGYDRRQVEDYVERVEVALGDADRQHAEDGERLAALQQQVTALHADLVTAEHRASGLPEPASLIGERLATMLRLAEEEADQIVLQAQDRAASSLSERTAELDRREEAIRTADADAQRTRLEAQQDAETVRSRSQQEADRLLEDAHRQANALVAQADEEAQAVLAHAEELATRKLRTAEEDVAILHEDARLRANQVVAEAERRVDELAQQRDTIAVQLDQLRETLSSAMKPLHPPAP